MRELLLRIRAPFAAFRWLQAGVYRATSPVIPPSAAWGLVLNLAGVETRGETHDGITTIRPDAPRLEIAVGSVHRPETTTLYQQLHTYPVGNSGKDRKNKSHGSKYWIAPTTREILVGLECIVGVRGDDAVLANVEAGIRGQISGERYGLPHAGDNNLLIDTIDVVLSAPPCEWYVPIDPKGVPQSASCRLTIGIDRIDASRTTSGLFAPTAPTAAPPGEAWTWVPAPPE